MGTGVQANLKDMVKSKYGEAARQVTSGAGTTGCELKKSYHQSPKCHEANQPGQGQIW